MLETFRETILSFEVFTLDMPDSKKYLRFIMDLLDKYSPLLLWVTGCLSSS